MWNLIKDAHNTTVRIGCFPPTSPFIAIGRIGYATPSLILGGLAAVAAKIAMCCSKREVDFNPSPARSYADAIHKFNTFMGDEILGGLLEIIPGIKMALAIQQHHYYADLDAQNAQEAVQKWKANMDTVYHFTDELGDLPMVSTPIGAVRIATHLALSIFNTIAYTYNKMIQYCLKDKALAAAKKNARWYCSALWNENAAGLGKGALEMLGIKGVLRLFFTQPEIHNDSETPRVEELIDLN